MDKVVPVQVGRIGRHCPDAARSCNPTAVPPTRPALESYSGGAPPGARGRQFRHLHQADGVSVFRRARSDKTEAVD
jgi:hypothetical protein